MSDITEHRAAFLYHYSQEVVMADQRLHKQEVTLLTALNPELIAGGLMSEDGTLLDRFETVRATTGTRLRDELSEAERRDLLDRLIQVMASDGDLDPKEWRVVREAATELGLPTP